MADDQAFLFSYPPCVWNESIGDYDTAECITYHLTKQLGHRPEPGQKVQITASTEPLTDQTTTLVLSELSDFGSYYHDQEADTEAWLCPLVDVLYGYTPAVLHVRITSSPSISLG